jgi:hypothetical protein
MRDCLGFLGEDMYGVGRLFAATGSHVSTTCGEGTEFEPMVIGDNVVAGKS